MAYLSSALGSNVKSGYLQYDNLRSDLTTGKFWNASNGTETQYLQITHDATNGNIASSTGRIILNPNNSIVRVRNAADATMYLEVDHDGTNSHITSVGSGGAQNLIISAAGGNIRIKHYSSNKYLDLSHDGTNGTVAANDGQLNFQAATGIFKFGTAATTLQIYDAANVLRTVTITAGGAWSIV